MFNAPRGHTSISFCDKLRDNWAGFQELIAGKGFASFNGYANNNFVEDLYENYFCVVCPINYSFTFWTLKFCAVCDCSNLTPV